MAKDIETLKQQALQIKNEVEDGANTADRVGGMFGDMLDYNEEKLTELSSGIRKDSPIYSNYIYGIKIFNNGELVRVC